ncbi:S-layer homology domain-containing protein [Paenibacillus sp. MAH-36]|uniref:S-layer homology domain-containing protein n=1 Tax=Paenibacillus violae TaxID=3077234 RepID=A0ABU3RD36_9BACL|nr:S-layer homology domain-containing protein [Paenibacillus sp. PFR10]MDU0202166.1 S-layer homology domain-containing protein [Paenibacillus sp. PFR10]
MKNYVKLAAYLMLMVSLTMSLLSTKSYAATAQPSFTVSFSSERVEEGQTVTMTIRGAQVTNLYGMEIVFTYDARRLQFVEKSGTQGVPDIIPNRELFPAGANLEVAPQVQGDRILYAITKTGQLPPSQGDVNLLSLNFTALAPGNADVTLVSVKLGASGSTPSIWTEGATSTLGISSKSAGGSPGPGAGPVLPSSTGTGTTDNNTNILQLTPTLSQETAKATLTAKQLKGLESLTGSNTSFHKTVSIHAVNGATGYALSIPSAFFQNTSGTKQLDIQTPLGTLTIVNDMLQNSDLAKSNNVVLSIRLADTSTFSSELKNSIGNHPVIDLNIEVDDQKLAWHNDKSPVTVSVAYQPSAEELLHPEHVNVWYIDDNGNVQRVPSGRYDAATGRVTFQTTHFSKYAIVYEIKSFADITDIAWARKAIEVLASKGIINGATDTTFGPSNHITRADFISLLVRTLGLKADYADGASFDDVKTSDYFFNSVSIARKLGITNGVDGNQFMPNAPISRQDLMVMTVRTLQLSNKLVFTSEASGLGAFTDNANVANYAKESVAALVKQGIISGDGTRLRPTDSMTRAEAAKLLYELYTKYIN